MRRGTRIAIVGLLLLLLGAGVAQLVIATGNRTPLRGPTSPGQLPSPLPSR